MRAALIEQGLQLLAERSVDDLSLRELARRVGVSATAVYRHFPDKGALMGALSLTGLKRLGEAQHEASAAAGGGEEGFAASGRAYVRFALQNPSLFRLIFSFPKRPDLLRSPSGAGSEPVVFLKANIAALLPEGAAAQEVELLAARAWALVHGLAMLMLDGQLPQDEHLIDRLLSSAPED